MRKRKQKRLFRQKGSPRCGKPVRMEAAIRRIRACLVRVQALYHKTGDPSDRVSLPVLEVSRQTGLTRTRTANLVRGMSPIRCLDKPKKKLSAQSFIVAATVKSPLVTKTAHAILLASAKITVRMLQGILSRMNLTVSYRVAVELVWEFHHPEAKKRLKKKGGRQYGS